MCVRLANENMDICEKHLSAAVARLSEDSETVLAKLVARCGKDSAIPLIMAIDSLTAGIDTTGILIQTQELIRGGHICRKYTR